MTAPAGAAETVALADTGNRRVVLHVSVDRFDDIAAVLGPDVVDGVLRTTAQRLAAVAPPGSRIGRAGDAGFVLECHATTRRTGLERLAATVLTAVQRSVLVDDGEVHVTASVGVAYATDDHADLDRLTTESFLAMRTARSLGGGQVVVHRPAMRRHAEERVALGAELRRAVVRDELRVHYQPTWEPTSLRIVGVEALVRWQHPTRGLLPPETFIPLAEDTGLIVPVGRFVLTRAVQQLDAWCRDPDLVTDELVMAVNLSARQLQDPGLVDDVAGLLAGAAFRPHQLCLEITESMLVQEGVIARATLSGLRRLGIRLAIDDFGTGFSSLAVLRQLPVDLLKIDRSFVRDLAGDHSNRQMVGAIVGLAHGLDLVVVAEGVETSTDLDAVRSLACDVVQGYGLARPADARDVTPLLRKPPRQPVRRIRLDELAWNAPLPAAVPASAAGTT